MKVAYLISAHNNPKLLARSVSRLSCPESGFFIHIDRKVDIRPFLAASRPGVRFTDARVPVYWGEFSVVQSILSVLHEALRSPEQYEYFVLLSGTDYPLRSGSYVRDFLERNRGQEYISLLKVPAPGKPVSRINTLWFPSDQPVRHFISRVLAKARLGQRDYRRYLGDLQPYSGDCWWALSREACQYVLSFMEQNPRFTRYFEDAFAADEVFFHTILANSVFRPRIRRNLHYEDWAPTDPSPKVIDWRHLPVFDAQERVCVTDVYGSGEVLFARKFSEERMDVLAQIDEIAERKERAAEAMGPSYPRGGLSASIPEPAQS